MWKWTDRLKSARGKVDITSFTTHLAAGSGRPRFPRAALLFLEDGRRPKKFKAAH